MWSRAEINNVAERASQQLVCRERGVCVSRAPAASVILLRQASAPPAARVSEDLLLVDSIFCFRFQFGHRL